MYTYNTTAEDAIWGGFIVFGACSLWGLRLLFRGIRGDINDAPGNPVARSWLILGGIVLQLPLVGFALFAWRQGFFGH